jgi:signal transduction histidine kinase
MNVVKYAGTKEVAIDLRHQAPDMLRITVRDEGVGFDPGGDHSGSGLAKFERRFAMVGGSLALTSAPGAGTTVTLRAPLESARHAGPAPSS